MYRAIKTTMLTVAGSAVLAGGALAADPAPVIPLPVVAAPEQRCDVVGYVDAYVGAGFGYEFIPPDSTEGILWADIAFGGAGRASIRCTPRFSIQLDAWGDHWTGQYAGYDDGGPYEPAYFDETTLGIGTHLTFHAGNFLVGPLASVGAVADFGTFVNVGIEAALNLPQFRVDAQVGFTPAVIGPAAAISARDVYAQVGATFYPSPNFSIGANVGVDFYNDTMPWFRRTLSWGAKIEFSPQALPIAFYAGYEGWHWGAGFDTDFDDLYGWEHNFRVGLRFMVGADTLRELDEAVGLIDENPIYGQAFGPTYFDLFINN